MPETEHDLEERLRAHLARVAEQDPRAGLEERIIARTAEPQPASWRQSLVLVAVMITAITMLLLLTVGHQVSNVFSNISGGLSN